MQTICTTFVPKCTICVSVSVLVMLFCTLPAITSVLLYIFFFFSFPLYHYDSFLLLFTHFDATARMCLFIHITCNRRYTLRFFSFSFRSIDFDIFFLWLFRDSGLSTVVEIRFVLLHLHVHLLANIHIHIIGETTITVRTYVYAFKWSHFSCVFFFSLLLLLLILPLIWVDTISPRLSASFSPKWTHKNQTNAIAMHHCNVTLIIRR